MIEHVFVGFWAPFLYGVKAQIVRAHLSHLFKWRGVRLGQKGMCSFPKKYSSKKTEREEEEKSLCDFHTSTKLVFQITTTDSFTVGLS